MTVTRPTPPPGSYWATTNVLAGPWPGQSAADLQAILNLGITDFVDLHGLSSYDHVLAELRTAEGRRATVSPRSFAITDFAAPTPELMRQILDRIHERVGRGERVYVHCLGGIGRTGTVIGCLLAELSQECDALEELRKVRTNAGLSGQSPETPE